MFACLQWKSTLVLFTLDISNIQRTFDYDVLIKKRFDKNIRWIEFYAGECIKKIKIIASIVELTQR
jgi:hypothetical protein